MAFTRALTERFGEQARFIHLGLTSTDVVDSAQNLVLREALTLILADAQGLAAALKEKAVTYKHTPLYRAHPRRSRRTDDLRAQVFELLRGVAKGTQRGWKGLETPSRC